MPLLHLKVSCIIASLYLAIFRLTFYIEPIAMRFQREFLKACIDVVSVQKQTEKKGKESISMALSSYENE